MIKKKIFIINKLGLHARAAAKFVSLAGRFGSNIEVSRENKTVNGKSIMGVMMLAASKGTELELTVSGDDESQALMDLENLINDRFGEAE
ncbi:MAG: phosphocarrier protein HPr [Legionellales bacterium]|nr:phosphocarrier protein HPr [Legionellales bacterium]|tara:strand:- start:14716 stop:14985 length:270 start_codon:yes stop_codon:yes gene_type:complete